MPAPPLPHLTTAPRTRPVTLRPATAADAPALAPLFDAYRGFYGQTSDPAAAEAFLTDRLAHDESVVFVAEDDGGRAVGFTQLYPVFSSVRLRRLWLLNDLFVAPEARRAGVGRALLDAAQAHAASTGACAVALATDAANTTAQRLYDAVGYVRDGAFHYERPVLSPPAP